MKLQEGFVLREVGDRSVVVASGAAANTFNGVIELNRSGVFLWHCLEQGCTQEELETRLVERYHIAQETAQEDVAAFVKTLQQTGVLQL